MRVTSGGAITTVVEGLGANLYPGYMCRAWVNFNGAATANITGTYSQSLTTVTITTSVAHGQLVGDRVYLDFTSGTGTDQGATVASVVSSTVFTATLTTSATTSGSVTVSRNAVRGGGNVSSVADLGTGNYAINMYVPAPHTNYAVTTGITLNGGNSFSTSAYVDSMSQEWFLIGTSTDNTRLLFDPSIVCVAVFY
ncbi:MAG: hypothetical protein EBV03_13850 [Proteobacteria bacterium]|nr:hypothetical protein [Pseudomonadota bacterium]